MGEPMEFWRRKMPAGMHLRSSLDWHLDPQGEHTLAAYRIVLATGCRADLTYEHFRTSSRDSL